MSGRKLEPGLPGLQTDAVMLASHGSEGSSFGSKWEKVSGMDGTVLGFTAMPEIL
jgi:hypothetical protein